MGVVYLNGEMVDAETARISVFDRGFTYGDGAFETVRSYGGCLFRAAAHWRRLARSLERLGIPAPLTSVELDEVCSDVLDANGLSAAVLRVRVSRGVGPGGPGTAFEISPTLVVTAGDFTGLDESFYTGGADVVVSGVRRVPDMCLPCEAKSANYLNSILARRDAEAAGAYEAIMLNVDGNVAEASASNVFLVAEGKCRTPDVASGILAGVTRATVIEVAAAAGYAVEEVLCTVADLRAADEVFLTNSVIELVPVRAIDGVPVSGQCPGPVTERLTDAYASRVTEECGL